MQGELTGQGLELMLFGMGTVLLFLTLLVLATALMSRVIGRFFPDSSPSTALSTAAQPPTSPDTRRVAAITAAVHRYRAEHG